MKLSEYLHKHKLTQETFALRLGKSQTLISAYCKETMVPPRVTALKIVEVTGGEVTLEDLWGVKIA